MVPLDLSFPVDLKRVDPILTIREFSPLFNLHLGTLFRFLKQVNNHVVIDTISQWLKAMALFPRKISHYDEFFRMAMT